MHGYRVYIGTRINHFTASKVVIVRVVKLQGTITKVAPVIVIFLAFVLMTLHISATTLPMEVPGHEQAGHEQEVGYEQVRPEQAGHVACSVNQADCLTACNGSIWPFVVRLMSSLYKARLHSLSLY